MICSRSELNRKEYGRNGQVGGEADIVEQDQMKQKKTVKNNSEPNQTEQNRAERNGAEQNKTEQNKSERAQMSQSGSGSENRRVCRRCLTREMVGQERIFETIRQYIENLEERDRAAGEVYERRLEGCRACKKLLEGLCLACGCYVEIRAAKVSQTCPHDKW